MSRKNFLIRFDIYPVEVMVSVNQGDGQLVKCIDKWKALKPSEKDHFTQSLDCTEKHAGVVLNVHDTGFIILRIFGKVKKPKQHGYLAHEIFHVVERIARYVELKHSEKSSEAFAYMISYLTTQIYKRLIS